MSNKGARLELNCCIELNPAHYRWSSYRANALGETTPLLTPHPLYATLGATNTERQAAYRALFNRVLPDKTIGDARLAVNQTQPLGYSRFFDAIEQATGQRRAATPSHAAGPTNLLQMPNRWKTSINWV